MTIDKCANMLMAKEKCMERETSGTDTDCNFHNCDDCSLCYEQGTTGEQKEALRFAVDIISKYQKIEEILKDIPYGGEATVRRCIIDDSCVDEMVSERPHDFPLVEAIPKTEYEARLKADMVAMLEDLDLQIDESAAYNLEVAKVQRLIRDKIDKLKENNNKIDKSNK